MRMGFDRLACLRRFCNSLPDEDASPSAPAESEMVRGAQKRYVCALRETQARAHVDGYSERERGRKKEGEMQEEGE